MKIYAILGAFGAAVLSLFAAFKKGEKSATNEIKAESQEAAREYQGEATDALIDGLESEQKVNENIDSNTTRDHFS